MIYICQVLRVLQVCWLHSHRSPALQMELPPSTLGLSEIGKPNENAPDPPVQRCRTRRGVSRPEKPTHFAPPSRLLGTPAQTNQASLSYDDRVISFPMWHIHLSSFVRQTQTIIQSHRYCLNELWVWMSFSRFYNMESLRDSGVKRSGFEPRVRLLGGSAQCCAEDPRCQERLLIDGVDGNEYPGATRKGSKRNLVGKVGFLDTSVISILGKLHSIFKQNTTLKASKIIFTRERHFLNEIK